MNRLSSNNGSSVLRCLETLQKHWEIQKYEKVLLSKNKPNLTYTFLIQQCPEIHSNAFFACKIRPSSSSNKNNPKVQL